MKEPARVHKALKLFVPFDKIPRGVKPVSMSSTDDDWDGNVVIRLSDRTWTMIGPHFGPGNTDTIEGCVGGYNEYARRAISALVRLRYFSQANAEQWHQWYYCVRSADKHKSKRRYLFELAESLGYRVVKKRART
jgi:hypothetical protein